MDTLDLTFRPIDFNHDVEPFLAFLRDTHWCSFGTMEGFADDSQSEGHYVERIRKRLADQPQSCLHVWENDRIIGQLHLGQFVDPGIGYINLLYVIPEYRGMGPASLMEDYACTSLQGLGFATARLSVTARNHRAIRFYLKKGWKDLGPTEDRPGTHNMEKVL